MLNKVLLCIFTFAITANAKTTHEATAKSQAAHHSSHSDHHAEVPGIDPDKALMWLKNGNTRYTTNKLRKDGQGYEDVKRLATGQTPHSIVLSCSDSRVPPEIVFDQKLGEIFTVRTAGETLDDAGIASMEYAVSHLGSQQLVVMGHTSCGAVKAALATLDGSDAGSPALNELVHDIHPRLASYKRKPQSTGVKDESWSNVKGVATDLEKRSAIIAKAIQSGKLKIRLAMYDLETGKVEFRD